MNNNTTMSADYTPKSKVFVWDDRYGKVITSGVTFGWYNHQRAKNNQATRYSVLGPWNADAAKEIDMTSRAELMAGRQLSHFRAQEIINPALEVNRPEAPPLYEDEGPEYEEIEVKESPVEVVVEQEAEEANWKAVLRQNIGLADTREELEHYAEEMGVKIGNRKKPDAIKAYLLTKVK